MAAIFVAEIGDVGRFRSAEAFVFVRRGLTPRHRESDTKVVRGGISTDGGLGWRAGPHSKRSPATKAAPDSKLISIASPSGAAPTSPRRRGAKLLTLVFYGLRDGEIRCLRDNVAVAA